NATIRPGRIPDGRPASPRFDTLGAQGRIPADRYRLALLQRKAVGQAIEDADIARDELFITTKLWFKDHGYDQTKQALQVSLDNRVLDYLDRWLLHQPFGDYSGAWRAMEALMDEGLVRAIGVSNYFDDRYFDLISHHRVVPAVNQRETNPLNQQIDTQALL